MDLNVLLLIFILLILLNELMLCMMIVEKTKDVKVLESKWLFKKKKGIIGVESARYKTRLVTQGFVQKKGIDFNEIFSYVVKFTFLRIQLYVIIQFDFLFEQMNVKTTFLHGDLDENIYMK